MLPHDASLFRAFESPHNVLAITEPVDPVLIVHYGSDDEHLSRLRFAMNAFASAALLAW
jgi:hypothetical protein